MMELGEGQELQVLTLSCFKRSAGSLGSVAPVVNIISMKLVIY